MGKSFSWQVATNEARGLASVAGVEILDRSLTIKERRDFAEGRFEFSTNAEFLALMLKTLRQKGPEDVTAEWVEAQMTEEEVREAVERIFGNYDDLAFTLTSLLGRFGPERVQEVLAPLAKAAAKSQSADGQ